LLEEIVALCIHDFLFGGRVTPPGHCLLVLQSKFPCPSKAKRAGFAVNEILDGGEIA
jgi:hypothetical protein